MLEMIGWIPIIRLSPACSGSFQVSLDLGLMAAQANLIEEYLNPQLN